MVRKIQCEPVNRRNVLSPHKFRSDYVRSKVKKYGCPYHVMKAYSGNADVAALFLNLSIPGRFLPSESTTGNYWARGVVGPRAGLDDWKKREVSWSCRDSNHPVA
jgi:hypothetical protein